MNNKILLINPSSGDSSGINEATIYPPLGLAYLASYLRKKGTKSSDISIMDANIFRIPNEEIIKIIDERKPNIVGIHMNIISAREGIELSKIIKNKYPKILICIGGPTVSSNPKEIIQLSNADIAVIGEGEETFLEICESIDFKKIKGIAYPHGKEIIFTEKRTLIAELDDIPSPAYDLLPHFSNYKSRARKNPVGMIITSRGCPYRCTFCNSSVFGKKFRAHSPKRVIEEIELLIKNYGIKQLDILDDNFTLDNERIDKILDLILEKKCNLKINIQNGVRLDRLTEPLVKKMKEAGVFKVGVGIESANEEILKSIKKDLDKNKVIESVGWFRKYGIITVGFFIIGFPNDTKETIRESINFALRINPSIANFMLLIPLPGTELHEYLLKNNLLLEPDRFYYPTGFYEKRLYHKCLNLTNKELFELQREAYSKFNFRISKAVETWLNVRSFNEFKWVLEASTSILKNIIFKNKSA